MNINKYTQKSTEALNNCEKLAYTVIRKLMKNIFYTPFLP